MIEVITADITTIKADAIVNAANSSLMGGGGVDGAIHRAGGPAILNECRDIVNRQGGCKTGEAVISTAGKLPAEYVIHTVGPVWQGGNKGEPELLKNAYLNSLKLAEKNNLKSIAFPGISTGIYGYPKREAAKIAIKTVQAFLAESKAVKLVTFVCFSEADASIYRALLNT
ncbi:MAG: O-acetyl-ADP-ribose deacetylase [Bacteroidota bacterium]